MARGLPATWLPACLLNPLQLLRLCLIGFSAGKSRWRVPGKSLSPLQQQSAGAKLVDGQSAPAKRAASAAEIHPGTLQISCRYFPSSIVPFSFRSYGRSFSLSFSSAYLYRDAIVLSGAPAAAATSSSVIPLQTLITTTSRCSSVSSASAFSSASADS